MDSQIYFLVIVVAVFYFLLIRPQQKRVKQHQALLGSISLGDQVVTAGGVFGTIKEIDEDSFHVEISPGVTVRFVKSAINRKVEPVSSDPELPEAG